MAVLVPHPAAARDFTQRRRRQDSSNRPVMVSKCANPSCGTDFKYFREGRIYEFVVGEEGACRTASEPPSKDAKRELFWLCQDCAQQYTLDCSDGAIHVIGREHKAA